MFYFQTGEITQKGTLTENISGQRYTRGRHCLLHNLMTPYMKIFTQTEVVSQENGKL